MRPCTGVQFGLWSIGFLLISVFVWANHLEEIGRDGDFVALANGVVVDTRTGLEWIAGPDVDTS